MAGNYPKYKQARQHQPLRVPDGWSGQARELVLELESLFDEVYLRLGRIRYEDLSPELKERLDGLDSRIETLESDE